MKVQLVREQLEVTASAASAAAERNSGKDRDAGSEDSSLSRTDMMTGTERSEVEMDCA